MGHPRMPGSFCVYLLVALAASFSGCAKEAAKPPPSPVPVLAATAAGKDVPVEIRAIGSVEAYSVVSVKSLVAGELIGVHFREGDDLRRGQLIFTIDPRPLEMQIRQAEANLARDTASAIYAGSEERRYGELYKKGIVAQEQDEQFRTQAEALKETVKADRATLDNLRVQLGYTRIHSPIDGRAGQLNVHEGNIVKENDTPYLVVINKVEPIYVTFSVPEEALPGIKRQMSKGPLKVGAMVHGDDRPAEGTLSFIDNAVDLTTGTIKLKATFTNSGRRLWPGQFVDVSLRLAVEANATVVPSQAVMTGQAGQYVFVIKPDMAVEMRPVTAGREYRGDSVIEKGLNPGERVVTDGQLRLVPGARVEVRAGLG